MNFSDKLRELREQKGWSQKELAERSGCSQTGIANWEQGTREPGFGAVQRLCEALGVDCTAFDGCGFEEASDKRGRGRPTKEEPPANSPKRKKKKGAS